MSPSRLLALLALAALPVCAQPTFECQTAPQLLTAIPDCEGLTGTVTASPSGDAYVDGAPSGCGFPTQGSQHLVVPGTNPANVGNPPIGGPVARPLPGGYNEVQIPIPALANDVALTWDFYNGEGGPTGGLYNDGMSIDVVDPSTGLSVLNIAYADAESTPLAPGGCIGAWNSPNATGAGSGPDTLIDGPQTVCVALPSLPPGAYLSIACWSGADDFVASAAVVDDVQWNTGCPPVSTPNMPNSAQATLTFTGSTCQPPATFPISRLVAPGAETLATVSTSSNGQQPFALVATVGTGTVMGPGLPTPFGILDLDATAIFSGNYALVLDGLGGTSLADQLLGNTGPSATRTLPLTLPGMGSGTWASFQALCADPMNPFGLTLTAATQIDFLGTSSLPGGLIGTTPDLAGDDTSNQLVFSTGLTIPFYGAVYSDVFINSNGNVTFGAMDTDFSPTVMEFLGNAPRIAPLWDDLSPNLGGTVAYTETATSLVVSWVGVPEFGTSNSNDAGMQVDNTGLITIAYGPVATTNGLVGISPGSTSPVGLATGASQDLSANLGGGIIGIATDALFENFSSGFDLAPPCYGGGVTFVPNSFTTTPGDAGYTGF